VSAPPAGLASGATSPEAPETAAPAPPAPTGNEISSPRSVRAGKIIALAHCPIVMGLEQVRQARRLKQIEGEKSLDQAVNDLEKLIDKLLRDLRETPETPADPAKNAANLAKLQLANAAKALPGANRGGRPKKDRNK
jgi:hypothetical protein